MFKDRYEIKIDRDKIVTVIPYYAIKNNIKRTTLRIRPKKTGIYNVRSGSYYRPNIWDYKIEIYSVREVVLSELTIEEIKEDIGLTGEQYNIILRNNFDLRQNFYNMLYKFNKNRLENFNIYETKFYLHYIRPVV